MESGRRRSWGMWWGCVVLGVVALGWGLAVRGEAKEDERVTLLVKCEKKVVAEVLARLSDSDVEIWDTRTMKALRSPNRKSDVPPAKATGLLDAQGAMLAMFEMVEATRGASGDTTLELESLVIQQLRAMFKLTFADVAAADHARRVILGHAWFREHATELASGALQRLSNGRHRTSFTLRLRPPATGTTTASQLTPLADVQKLAQASTIELQYVGAEQVAPNRAAGHQTQSREFTFGTVRLPQFVKFLEELAQHDAGATITEIRLKRADAKERAGDPQRLRKPVIRLAVRNALP